MLQIYGIWQYKNGINAHNNKEYIDLPNDNNFNKLFLWNSSAFPIYNNNDNIDKMDIDNNDNDNNKIDDLITKYQ